MPCQTFRAAISLLFSGLFLPNGVAENWRMIIDSCQRNDLVPKLRLFCAHHDLDEETDFKNWKYFKLIGMDSSSYICNVPAMFFL